jgi:hypothetical protein
MGYVATVVLNKAFVWLYQTNHHIKGSGFASTIRAKKTNYFAFLYVQRNVVNNFSFLVGFADSADCNFVWSLLWPFGLFLLVV